MATVGLMLRGDHSFLLFKCVGYEVDMARMARSRLVSSSEDRCFVWRSEAVFVKLFRLISCDSLRDPMWTVVTVAGKVAEVTTDCSTELKFGDGDGRRRKWERSLCQGFEEVPRDGLLFGSPEHLELRARLWSELRPRRGEGAEQGDCGDNVESNELVHVGTNGKGLI